MKRLVGVVLVVLAGCAPAPPADTAQGRCQQQADSDPAVKAVLIDAPVYGTDPRFQDRLAQARRKAVQDCLVASGADTRGGVEPVNRVHYGLGWY